MKTNVLEKIDNSWSTKTWNRIGYQLSNFQTSSS